MNTQQPMPAELANARPPTRQDAIARIRFRGGLGSRTIEEFGDSLRGQQCARGTYTTQMCADYRAEFERGREAAIADALLTLTHEYEEVLGRRAQIDAANAEALEAETAMLRTRYLATPGATQSGFSRGRGHASQSALGDAGKDERTHDDADAANEYICR